MSYAEEQVEKARKHYNEMSNQFDMTKDELKESEENWKMIDFLKLVADVLDSNALYKPSIQIRVVGKRDGYFGGQYCHEKHIEESQTPQDIDHLRAMVETIEDMYYDYEPPTEDYYEINVKVSKEYLESLSECEKPRGELGLQDVIKWEALIGRFGVSIKEAIDRGKKEVVIK